MASGIVGRLMHWLRWYATTDELTGAVTRHALWAVAESQLAGAQRRSEPLTVAVVDLDDFKIINDQQGHAAGDRVLVEVVREWRARLRAQDVIARTGGHEFVLVLPGTGPDAARKVLRELQRSSLARWSVGVALAGPGETLAQVIARADEDLYRAKEVKGRSSEARGRALGTTDLSDVRAAPGAPTPSQP